jgi:polysaccharide deacetylase 2 family uncharacterized protein YibQ
LPIAAPHAMAGVLGLLLITWTAWAVIGNDPLGGEPKAVVSTGAAPSKPARAMPTVASQDQGPRNYDGPGDPPRTPSPVASPNSPPAAPGTKTVTIIDGSTGKRQEVPIPSTRDVRAPVEQRLLESSRHGAIPRIAPDGARPADVYAQAVRPSPNRRNAPRVAIVVGGLGTSNQITQRAIEKLPKAVTLSFQPYGAGVDRDATSARADGHEVLLQVPMEPFDYPDNDPGPQTLLTSLSDDKNADRLHWLMSRFQGYVGVANYMGARFTSSEQSLAPVLKESARRGLIYFDDGSSARSLAGQIASANKLPFAKAEIVIDAVPTPANIDRALSRLEATARERGAAIGYASALPASIERIEHWAKAAEARGILLVPISAMAIKPKSS